MGGKDWQAKAWRNQGGQAGGAASGQRSWEYWRGAKSVKSPRGAQFPAYDGSWQPPWRNRPEEPAAEASFLQTLQTSLNTTRKAEQRVASLTAALARRKDLWEQYTRDMKAALKREHQRFNKDYEKLQEDLGRAQVAQAEARRLLLAGYGTHAAPTQDVEMVDHHFGSLMDSWMAEPDSGDAQAVLQRALSAAGSPLPTAPAPPGLAPPAAHPSAPVGLSSNVPAGHAPPHGPPDTPPPALPENMRNLIDNAVPSPTFGAGDPYIGAATRDPYLPSPGSAFLKVKPPPLSPSARFAPYGDGSASTGPHSNAVPPDLDSHAAQAHAMQAAQAAQAHQAAQAAHAAQAAQASQAAFAAQLQATRAMRPFGCVTHVPPAAATGLLPSIDPTREPIAATISDDDELTGPTAPGGPGPGDGSGDGA